MRTNQFIIPQRKLWNTRPYETLCRLINDRSDIEIGKAQRRPVLLMEEEKQLIVALVYSARCDYPQGRDDVAEIVKTFLDTLGRESSFDNNHMVKDLPAQWHSQTK